MSNEITSAVAKQSNVMNKKTFIVGLAATAALVAGILFAPAAGALSLDNVNLGTGLSTQDGDEWSSLGLRIASQDGLENLGVGTMLQNADGDEMQSLGTSIETTDDLDNIKVGTDAMSRDGDEWSALNLGAETQDGLENLSTNVGAETHDGDEHTNFGIKFSFDE